MRKRRKVMLRMRIKTMIMTAIRHSVPSITMILISIALMRMRMTTPIFPAL